MKNICLLVVPMDHYLMAICSGAPTTLKFICSEKTTKFCKIFPLLLPVCTVVKSQGKISQNFVAFSEYMNFIPQHPDSCWYQRCSLQYSSANWRCYRMEFHIWTIQNHQNWFWPSKVYGSTLSHCGSNYSKKSVEHDNSQRRIWNSATGKVQILWRSGSVKKFEFFQLCTVEEFSS